MGAYGDDNLSIENARRIRWKVLLSYKFCIVYEHPVQSCR